MRNLGTLATDLYRLAIKHSHYIRYLILLVSWESYRMGEKKCRTDISDDDFLFDCLFTMNFNMKKV